MNFRTLLRHTLIYASGIWAGKIIGFIMIPIYTRVLRPSDYGVLELISRTTDIIALVLGMGMASAMLRFHAEAKSDQERRRVVNTAVVCAGAVGVIAAVGFSAFAVPLSKVCLGSVRYALCFRLALIAMGCELCAAVPMVLVRIHERSALFAGVNFGRLAIALCLNIYLVVVLRLGVMGIMISNLIGIAAVLAVLGIVTWRDWSPRLDSRLLKVMLAYSLPLVPCSFAMFVLNFGDRYFVRHYCGLGVLGVYSLGYKICMMMPAMVMDPLGLAWSVVMFTVAARSDAARVYARFFNGFMFCVAFVSLGLSAISHDLVSVMADRTYHDAYKIVPAVMLGMAAWAASNVFETGVLLEKKTYFRTIGHLTSAIVVTAAYMTLIPLFGAMGAAWATVCGFVTMAATTYFFARRLYPIPYDIRRLAVLIGVAAAIYGASQLVPGAGTASTVLIRTMLVLAYPVVLYLVGYFEPENVATAKDFGVSILDRVNKQCRKSASL